MEKPKSRRNARTSLKRSTKPTNPNSIDTNENDENIEPCIKKQKLGRKGISPGKKNILGALLENSLPPPTQESPKESNSFREKNKDMRRQLHLGHATVLCCRERESTMVRDFILDSVKQHRNASLYVSGPPGTGKTAVVTTETNQLAKEGKCNVIHINCMHISSPGQLYLMLLKEISKKSTINVQENRALDELETVLNKRSVKFPLVIVLDEMDQLGVRLKETLYRIFDWVGVVSCRLMLIGIANALDLTDRLLPRLQLREHKPRLVHFPPYTPGQIAQIVTDRFTREEQGDSQMGAMALQLCAKKVAASSGDVRSALDIYRRSLELAEREARRQKLPSPHSPGLAHVSRAIEASRSGGNGFQLNGGSTSGTDLPLQQQMAVAAAMLIRRSGRKEWSLGALYDRYSALCKERRIGPLDAAEFSGLCQLLEARGLLQVRPGKEVRMTKLALRLDDRGLETRLSDQPLLTCLLNK